MRSIWKFHLRIDRHNAVVVMPIGAKILHLDVQSDVPMLWAMVDPTADMVKETFTIFGTGAIFNDEWDDGYVGTVQIGSYVWHVFRSGPQT